MNQSISEMFLPTKSLMQGKFGTVQREHKHQSNSLPLKLAKPSVANNEAAQRDSVNGFAYLLTGVAPVDLQENHNLQNYRSMDQQNAIPKLEFDILPS